MSQTPEQFLTKNLKWFTLAFACLFLFKTMQSCNRKMQLSIAEKKYSYIIDSLETKYNNLNDNSRDSIKKLNFELSFAKEQVHSANDRASAVQHAVEKLKSNTTVVVKGAEKIDETTPKK